MTLFCEGADADLLEEGAQHIPIRPRERRISLISNTQFVNLVNGQLDRRREDFDIILGFGYTLTCPHHVSVAQFVHDAWGRSPVHTVRVQRNLYGLYQGAYTALNTRWERRAFRQAHTVVACSNSVAGQLAQIGVPEQKIQVILNGADPQEFHPGTVNRADLNLPPDVPLALFAGDIRTPRKNLDTVLRAIQKTSDTHLAVVGNLKGSPYPRMAASLGITSRVHFLGYRRDMAQIMRAVDVFAFPSHYEPFGIVVLEAMNSGIPVITSANVGAAEIITPESGIVLNDPNDAEAMAHAMHTLLKDRPRRQRMGLAARAAAERHTWNEMSQRYWRLFEEITDSKEVASAPK